MNNINLKLKVMDALDRAKHNHYTFINHTVEQIAIELIDFSDEFETFTTEEITPSVEFWLEWQRLTAMTPEQLEDYRREKTNELINAAPKRVHMKLKVLQARCDGINRKIKNPLVSAGMMSQLMYEDGLQKLDGVLNRGEGLK